MVAVTSLNWRKSSYSGAEGGQCVELADMAAWRKSSYSGNEGGECIELAELDHVVGIRDSKNPDAAVLLVSRRELVTFFTQLKRRGG